MDALRALGIAARNRAAARVIAVTGSVGKTGTKDALRTALEAQGPTAASVGSFNNHWGVPLSLARMPKETAFGVFEVGMNHAGEIEPLSRMIRPDVAIVTTVEPAHIEFFDSIEAIADAKAEIFLGMTGGTAVLNRDNGQYDRLAAAAKAAGVGQILGFGTHAKAEARLISHAADGTGTNVEAVICGRRIGYRLSVPGKHHVMNSLAVLAAVSAAGANVAAAARTLGQLAPLAGRGRRHSVAIPGGSFSVVDESYNANPASMRAAIETLAATRPDACGRRIAALGEMRELGRRSAEFHLALADILKANGVDRVFACGPAMKPMFDSLPKAMRGGYAPESSTLARQVSAAIRGGDVVVVKGSLASGMKVVVDALLAAGSTSSRAVNG
jgi:UDP-N-acetylmuramoyl-tripeptide--D-alanyl-D-alanine ligase